MNIEEKIESQNSVKLNSERWSLEKYWTSI